jgi:hypothetical protein
MSTNTNEPTVHTIMRQVAQYIDGWEYVQKLDRDGRPSYAARLANDDGAEIIVRLSRGRLRAYGVHPKDHYPNEEDRITITMSPKREPKSLAGDFLRRLIPGYLENLQETRARAAEYAEHERKIEALRAELAEILDEEVGWDGRTIYHHTEGGYVRVRATGSSVEIDGYFLPSTARAVCQLLANE